ncbi:tetratricopeptide repeat protein [Candidatus Neomarinimicrobiota bacterium]
MKYLKLFLSSISIVLIALNAFSCKKENLSKIPITTNSEKALEYYKEGEALSQKLRGQEAVYYYLKAIAEDRDFALAYMQLAVVQTTPKLVFKYLDKAKSLSKNISEGEQLTILAVEATFDSDREKENNYYLELIEKYPNDEMVQLRYGNFLYSLPKYKAAIRHMKKAIEINPELSQPYNMLGYTYRQLGDYDEAEKYFKQYIDLIQDDPNPYDSYAELLLKKGEFEESIKYYQQALEMQPKFIPSIIGIANNLMLMERHEDACDELERIESLSNDPGNLKAMHFAKAVVNVDIGNFERAIKEINENISISESIDDDLAIGQDLRNLGVLHIMQGNYEKALKYSEKSIEYFEKSKISQDLKYYLRRQLFRTAGWVAYYEKDIDALKRYKDKYQSSAQKTLNPNEIRNVHELAGHIKLLEENYINAIREYKQADQQDPLLLYLIGTAYEDLGDVDKAREIYESVAHFNSYNDLNYAFIRKTALAKLND